MSVMCRGESPVQASNDTVFSFVVLFLAFPLSPDRQRHIDTMNCARASLS